MKKSGNISLIVLFILTITSLIGLLAIRHIQNMISYNTTTIGYYKAYYYAKAGTELGIVTSNLYEIGFEDVIGSGNEINRNFTCPESTCGFSTIISTRTHNWVTNMPDQKYVCTEENAFSLQEGESLIVPLFVDTRKISTSDGIYPMSLLPNIDIGIHVLKETSNQSGTDIGIGFSLGSGHEKLDRDILYKEFTGIVTYGENETSPIINEFLSDTTPMYFKYLDTKEIDPASMNIMPKKEKFKNSPNFLIIRHPHRCPTNTEESGKLLSEVQTCTCTIGTYSSGSNQCVDTNSLQTADAEITSTTTENTTAETTDTTIQAPTIETQTHITTAAQPPIRFCLQVRNNEEGLPTQYTTINSIGRSHNIQTSLQAVKKIYLPDWLFSTIIERQ